MVLKHHQPVLVVEGIIEDHFTFLLLAMQVMYARMEEADALIESLMQDKDPNLRQSGMYTVAMAYCGTGNNKAIKRLLHVAVSYDFLCSPGLLKLFKG